MSYFYDESSYIQAPGSSTNGAVAKFSSSSTAVESTGITVDGSNNILTPGAISASGQLLLAANNDTDRRMTYDTEDTDRSTLSIYSNHSASERLYFQNDSSDNSSHIISTDVLNICANDDTERAMVYSITNTDQTTLTINGDKSANHALELRNDAGNGDSYIEASDDITFSAKGKYVFDKTSSNFPFEFHWSDSKQFNITREERITGTLYTTVLSTDTGFIELIPDSSNLNYSARVSTGNGIFLDLYGHYNDSEYLQFYKSENSGGDATITSTGPINIVANQDPERSMVYDIGEIDRSILTIYGDKSAGVAMELQSDDSGDSHIQSSGDIWLEPATGTGVGIFFNLSQYATWKAKANSSTEIDSTGRLYLEGSQVASETIEGSTGAGTTIIIDTDGVMLKDVSSIDYKKNIKAYNKGLSHLGKLRPIYYRLKNQDCYKADDDDNEPKTPLWLAGFTAEDMHDAGFSEFVNYKKVKSSEGSPAADDDCKKSTWKPESIRYDKMVAFLTNCIKEQQGQIDELRKAIKKE